MEEKCISGPLHTKCFGRLAVASWYFWHSADFAFVWSSYSEAHFSRICASLARWVERTQPVELFHAPAWRSSGGSSASCQTHRLRRSEECKSICILHSSESRKTCVKNILVKVKVLIEPLYSTKLWKKSNNRVLNVLERLFLFLLFVKSYFNS